MKTSARKGFTLAELLIVVAIIAILIAILIPILSGQLERSRESADASNLRSAYSEAMTAMLQKGTDSETVVVYFTQTRQGQQSEDEFDLPFTIVSGSRSGWAALPYNDRNGYQVTFTVDEDEIDPKARVTCTIGAIYRG